MRAGPSQPPYLRAGSQAVGAPTVRHAGTCQGVERPEPIERVKSQRLGPLRTDPIASRILAATAELVRIPSQGGIDDPRPICNALIAKLAEAGITGRLLTRGTTPVGVVAEIQGAKPGPTYCLNAVVDTAPVGDAKRWSTLTPFSAELRGNRLIGRGVGDSKVAAAMFIEVGRELARRSATMHGRAVLFFDAAEHAGDFAGMLAFVSQYGRGTNRVQGMVIGYPGDQSLQIGSRGFHRTQWRIATSEPSVERVMSALDAPLGTVLPEGRSIDFPLATKRTITAVRSESLGATVGAGTILEVVISGKGGHSGAGVAIGINAIQKASTFLAELRTRGETLFGKTFAPRVLAMTGGKDFSVVPDQVTLSMFVPDGIPQAAVSHVVAQAAQAVDDLVPSPTPSLVGKPTSARGDERSLSALTLNVDVRTTMAFDVDQVDALTRQGADKVRDDGMECDVATAGAWPAFRLPQGSQLAQAMQQAINAHASRPVTPRISGPSNAGNVAAAFGIPATAGFGVVCKHAHGTDESIDVSTIPVAYAVHLAALETLFNMRERRSDAEVGELKRA